MKISFQAYADGKGPDQTAHPRSLIRAFAVRPFDVTVYRCITIRIYAFAARIDPSLPSCPKGIFSHNMAYLLELLHSFGLRSVWKEIFDGFAVLIQYSL